MSLFNEIAEIEKERATREKVILNAIYERSKNRIKLSVKARAKSCIFSVPEFMFGYPLTNVPVTVDYLIKKLREEGFYAIEIKKGELYITWDIHEIRNFKGDNTDDKVDRIRSMITINDNNNIAGSSSLVENKGLEKINEEFINKLVESKRSSDIF